MILKDQIIFLRREKIKKEIINVEEESQPKIYVDMIRI